MQDQTTTPFDFKNKASLQVLREAANALLKQLEQSHGVSMTLGSCSFTDGEATYKANARAAGVSEIDLLLTKQAKALNDVRSWYPNIDFDKVYTVNGKPMRLVGYDHKARAKPFVAQDAEGKRYGVPSEFLLKQNPAPADAKA